MSTRRDAREWAVQILFQMDLNPRKMDELLQDFWSEREPDYAARAFTEELVNGVKEHKDEVDALISKYAQHWDIMRIGTVERSVLRLALYEIYYRDDIPAVVSINEAVDLANYFNSAESGKFVNGILDHARKDMKKDDGTVGQ